LNLVKTNLRKGIGILGITGIIDYSLEFLKSLLIAGYFGIAAQVDAFYSGKSLPELFISLIASASYGAIIPNYPPHSAHESEKSKVMISALITVGGFGFIAFSLGATLSNLMSRALFAGLEQESLSIASLTMALFFLSGIFRIVVSILRSYYDHVYQFLIPASLDLLLPIFSIVLMIFFHDRLGVITIPIGFLGASILICFFLYIWLSKGFPIEWKFSLDGKAIRNIFTLLPPLALGSLAYRINAVIDRIFASNLAVGSIASLQFGYNPLNIFHAIVSVPITSALFPILSQKIRTNDLEDIRRITKKTLRLLMPLSVWGLWMLIFFRREVVSILYGRGAFDARAVDMTSTALFFYAFSFSVFASNSLFIRILMSIQYKTALYILGIWSISVNFLGDWLLGYYFQLAGIAVTTSIVHISWSVIAYSFVRKKIGNIFAKQDLLLLLILTTVSFGISFLAYKIAFWFVEAFLSQVNALLRDIITLLVGGGISVACYLIVLYWIKLPELQILRSESKRIFDSFTRKLQSGKHTIT
jgi:putative peptidoglycan lipid II flippase